MRTFLSVIGAATILLTESYAFADKPIFTETYDNPRDVVCEGLNLNGVMYSFTINGEPAGDAGDCIAGILSGPGETNNINPPNMLGNTAGVLHLRFEVPTTEFGFGVAVGIATPHPEGDIVIISLNRPGIGLLQEEVILEPNPDPFFPGGRFDYSGPAIRTVTIQFRTGSTRFAIDNVEYFSPF